MKYILITLILVGIILTAKYYLFSKFQSAKCVKDFRDGYIWHINNYNRGKYHIMGWQDGAWGNEVEMEKGVLERKDISGIQIYNVTTCPEYSPK